ncbi:MAG: uracil-DNA glycosylase [Candidatus Moranbacteria bacterium]|nr:uracil-DNA glycosylase [Candidatus Moranbacteria bacterium]
MNDSVHNVKDELLRELNERMASQCQCSLRKEATQAVPGSGSASAEIVFIGEAPGKNEDLKGVPFVGAAGIFLEEMLLSVGLRREDIYITNIVKYRPPENRDPFPPEISDCAEWLREQITLIDPLLIVTLGRHALNHYLPDQKISEVHGKAFRKTYASIGTRVLVPLYHPAAALYNGSMRNTLKMDFMRIPAILNTARLEKENDVHIA